MHLRPLVTMHLKMLTRQELRKAGVGPVKAAMLVWSLDEEQVSTYSEIAAVTVAVPIPAAFQMPDPSAPDVVGALGDGELLKVIIEWLKSPEGQAFLSELFKMLLALLMGL